MRSAYAKTKERAEEAQYASENNANEYASDRVESTVDRTTHEVVYQADKQGRKSVKTTKENISKAKEQIRQFKEKRAATNVYGNTKTVRTAKETEHTWQHHWNSNAKHRILCFKL